MSIRFFGNFISAKGNQAVRSAIEAIVRFDPKGASEADLRTMEQHLDAIGKKVSEARTDYEREKKEADKFRGELAQMVAAVDVLKRRVDAASDPAEKERLTGSLRTLVERAKSFKVDTQAEIEDETNTKLALDELLAAYQAAGTKLRDARAELQRAQREMEAAGRRKDAAEARAQTARETAGLVGARDSVDTALKAMRDATARSKAEAATLDDKAKVLTPTDPLKDDPEVAAALREASGAKPTASLDDDIASLKL